MQEAYVNKTGLLWLLLVTEGRHYNLFWYLFVTDIRHVFSSLAKTFGKYTDINNIPWYY